MNATQKTPMPDAGKTAAEIADRIAAEAREGGKAVTRGAEDAARAVKRGAEDVADAVKDKTQELADDGESRLGKEMRRAQHLAQDAKEAIVAGAGSTLANVRDAAIEKADDARETLSDVGDRIAASLERTSEGADDDALKSRVLTSVAQGLTKASATLRQRSVADLSDDVKKLAKRHPGAFMAVAAVVGFAAARYVRASAQRRAGQNFSDHTKGRQP